MVALTALALWAAYEVRGALLLVFVSAILAIGFSPIVRFIEKRVLPVGRRIPRPIAILVLYVGVLGLLTIVLTSALPPLFRQAGQLREALPDLLQRAQAWLVGAGLLDHEITWQEAFKKAPPPGDAFSTIAGAVGNIIGGIVGLITVLILTFYLLVEGDGIVRFFVTFARPENRMLYLSLWMDISSKVAAWLNGQLFLALVIGSTTAIGLGILGVPYVLILSTIAGIGEVIPVVGPLLSAIPAILVALTVSPLTALFTAVFFLVQQQFENHILVPRIMSKQLGVSAVTVLVALMIGSSLLGIMGALLAVPSAAIAQVPVEHLRARREEAFAAAAEGPGEGRR
jgi:predicted PurR-regulated permease PerM